MLKLLAGTALIFGVQTQASAAEIIEENHSYLRVCEAFGTAFHYIPGTETCLKFSGRVRAEIGIGDDARTGGDEIADRSFLNSHFKLVVNATSMTEIGLLVGQFDITAENGELVEMGDAWITIGENILVGRETSHFDFGGGYGYYGGYYDEQAVEQFTFIAPLGNGVSATIGLEDGRDRGNVGMDLPDIIGSLRLSQGWGSLHMSAALHEWDNGAGAATDEGWGFAFQAGAEVNLGVNTTAKLVAGYAREAQAYTGGTDVTASGIDLISGSFTRSIADDDGSRSWYVLAGVQHKFNGRLTGSLNGSYNDFQDNDFDVNIWQIDGTLEYEVVDDLLVGIGLKYQNIESRYSYFQEDPITSLNILVNAKDDVDNWEAKLRVQRNF